MRRRSLAALAVLVALVLVFVFVAVWPETPPATPSAGASKEAPAATRGEGAAPRTRERTRPPAAPAATQDAAAPPTDRDALVATVRTTDGSPVPGIVVVATDVNGQADTAETNERGRAAFPLEPRRTSVLVRLVGPARRTYLPVDAHDLAAGERAVEFVLEAGTLVRGRVLAPDGKGIDSIRVAVVERPSGRAVAPILTEDDGRFEALVRAGSTADAAIEGTGRGAVPGGSPSTLTIGSVESPWSGRWPGLAPGVEHTLRAVPLALASLHVRVVTPDGSPVPGALVTTRLGTWTPTHAPIRTGEDGRAEVPDLARRERRVIVELGGGLLSARASPSGGAWVAPEPTLATPGDEEIVLTLRPARQIAGRIVRESGDAVGWCGIEVHHGDDLVASATSGPDGAFSVAIEDDAPAPLCVSAFTYHPANGRLVGERTEVWPGTTDLRIEVAPAE